MGRCRAEGLVLAALEALETRARMGANPSDINSPRDTPSHRARSMSSGSRLVAAVRSAAKHAPRRRSSSRTSAVAPTVGSTVWPPARAAETSQGRSARKTTAMGVALEGGAVGASGSSRGRGVSRSQATSPLWESWSSQAES